MKAIAEKLKSLGPNYKLEWRMEYIGPDRSLIMTLVYFDSILNFKIQHQTLIPFDHIIHMDKHAHQLLDDMHMAVTRKKMEEYAKIN